MVDEISIVYKDKILKAIAISNEIKKETGIDLGVDGILRIAISMAIENSRKNSRKW